MRSNFRADRMVEMSKAFEYADFNAFDRVRMPKDLKFVGMMQYDGDLHLPTNFLVPPPEILHVSGEYLAKNGISTFACSETQKFGHVTFFWNGNRSGYFDAVGTGGWGRGKGRGRGRVVVCAKFRYVTLFWRCVWSGKAVLVWWQKMEHLSSGAHLPPFAHSVGCRM